MGLDMYLESANRTDHTIEELEAIGEAGNLNPNNQELEEFFPLYTYPYLDGYYSIFTEEAYWRKFNGLHNWFVTNVQNGVDDCSRYEVNIEHLRQLLNDLILVKRGDEIESLEPISGFFFGSTDKDEYYTAQIDSAYKIISNLLKSFDFSKRRLFYLASW
jgi:hypothetical protein